MKFFNRILFFFYLLVPVHAQSMEQENKAESTGVALLKSKSNVHSMWGIKSESTSGSRNQTSQPVDTQQESSSSSSSSKKHRYSPSSWFRRQKAVPTDEASSAPSASTVLTRASSPLAQPAASSSSSSVAGPIANVGQMPGLKKQKTVVFIGQQDLDDKHAESDDDEDGGETECDNIFTIPPTVEKYFNDTLLPLVKPEDRQECQTIFYLETPTIATVFQADQPTRGMNKEEKAQHKARCVAQKYLRAIVNAALGDTTKKYGQYHTKLSEMSVNLKDCDTKAKQEAAAVVVNLERQKSSLETEKSSLEAERGQLTGQIASHQQEMQSLTRRYRSYLGLAMSITAASLIFARYAFAKSRTEQATTA